MAVTGGVPTVRAAKMIVLELISGLGALIALTLMSMLFLFWVLSLFLLVSDSISFGRKVVWFVALTCLAPFAIPFYFIARSRHSQRPAPCADRADW